MLKNISKEICENKRQLSNPNRFISSNKLLRLNSELLRDRVGCSLLELSLPDVLPYVAN